MFVKKVPFKPLVPLVRRLLVPVRRLAQRDRQTDRHTHRTSTVTLVPHACQGLMKRTKVQTLRTVALHATIACREDARLKYSWLHSTSLGYSQKVVICLV